jgi:hypothetical protein
MQDSINPPPRLNPSNFAPFLRVKSVPAYGNPLVAMLMGEAVALQPVALHLLALTSIMISLYVLFNAATLVWYFFLSYSKPLSLRRKGGRPRVLDSRYSYWGYMARESYMKKIHQKQEQSDGDDWHSCVPQSGFTTRFVPPLFAFPLDHR